MDFEKLVVSLFFAGIFSMIVGVTVYNLHANAVASLVIKSIRSPRCFGILPTT